MLYREIIAVCSEIHTKHINTLCVENVELYAFFCVIPWHLEFICRRFGAHCLFHLHRQVDVPMKMEQTECFETSAYKLQTPGNYPKESIKQDYVCYRGATTSRAPGPPPHYRAFTITLRHTSLGRTPLDEWLSRLRDLYLTTHNTHKRETSYPQRDSQPQSQQANSLRPAP